MAARNGRVTPKKEPEFVFDPDRLEVGDLMDLEEHFGLTFMQLISELQGKQLEALTAKTLAAFTFLVMRIKDPDFAPQDARKIKVTDLKSMTSTKQVAQAKQRLANAGGTPSTTKDFQPDD